MSRKTVVVVLGTVLVAIPVLAYRAYVYAYQEQFLPKEYPWLTDLGRHLWTIAAIGLVLEAVAWVALIRYATKRRAAAA
jgi:hypothetical protein